MDRGTPRTIVITTGVSEQGSSMAEDAGPSSEVEVVKASLSIGEVGEHGDVKKNDVHGALFENWIVAAGADILDVHCKSVTGQLHKARLGSGGRGRCILRQGKWLTPTEFEALSGRGQSKDWKRSIRFGDKNLQSVIDAGLLLPHAATCACANCSEDPEVSGPVKLFTPYRKRKFRSATGPSPPPPVDPSSVCITEVAGDSDCPPAGEGEEELDLAADVSSLPTELMWDKLEEMSRNLLRQALSLKQAVRACRERSASTTATADDANGGPGQMTPPPEPRPVRPANVATMCSNCNRPPSLECSACHAVTYCSPFCCERDWPDHRRRCRPDDADTAAATSVMFILADGSERLITV